MQQGGEEEDGHRRALCGGFRRQRDARTGEHGAAAARTVCALIRRTILLSPHTLLRTGHVTPRTGCIILRRHPFGVTARRRAGLWRYALIAPVCPRCASSRISPCLPARLLSSNARGPERKLGLADRKSLIRFFFSFCAVVYLREDEGSEGRAVAERRRKERRQRAERPPRVSRRSAATKDGKERRFYFSSAEIRV